MSRISDTKDAAQGSALALVRAAAHAIADPSALTAAALTVAYTTDDPSFTANGAQTIADGDAPTQLECLQSLLEVEGFFSALLTDVTDLRTAIIAFLASGAESTDGVTDTVNATFPSGIAFTYTTDNPSFTANNAVTVADGDSVTGANNLEIALELNAELVKQKNDVNALRNRFNALARWGNIEPFSLGPPPALTSASNPITFTYTTDNPSITPNGSVTINDGDNPSAASVHELAVELDDQVTKLRADINAVRTTLVSLYKQAGIV